MKITRFEDIESWKEARKLFYEIHSHFSKINDYAFRDQVRRAALSVMSNIAEGFDRGTNKEFVQFLIFARGSVSEVKSLTYAALDVGYLRKTDFEKISMKCAQLMNLINGFIRYLKKSDRKH